MIKRQRGKVLRVDPVCGPLLDFRYLKAGIQRADLACAKFPPAKAF
jgi:hypothetical protein